MVAFVASIVECFTGYLSQQNFDSQWIATNGKDAFNAAGVGAFFNLMNFGQMLLWHVVLIPVVLIALVGAHVLLVRVRGVSHPLPARYPTLRMPTPTALRELTGRQARAERRASAGRRRGALARPDQALRHPQGRHHRRAGRAGPHGGAGRRAVLARRPAGHRAQLGAGRARPTSSAPRRPSSTGRAAPPRYGPPYNSNGTPQSVLFAPANIAGVRQPIDTAQTFVLDPLAKAAPTDPQLAAALRQYNAAPAGAAGQVGRQLRKRRRRR